MYFKQIRSKDESGTLSYLIADETTKNGIIIDPNVEDLQTITYLIDEENIKLNYVIDTHTHADHVSAASDLNTLYGSKLVMHSKTIEKVNITTEADSFGIGDIVRANAKNVVDKFVEDNDELIVDSIKIKFLYTPGHTDNHVALLIDDMLFTGDLLLAGQAGRSDLPGGNTEDQYDSIYNKVLRLPDNIKIYPGHDYEETEYVLLGDEKKDNPFLNQPNKKAYVEFVKDFFPPFADSTKEGKVTVQCGTKRVATSKEPFKDINPAVLAKMIKEENDLFLLDVREPFELMAFGKVPGVVNIPIGQITSRINEIPKDKKVVVICQSGSRSYEVTHYLSKNGYDKLYNLESGTSSWVYSRDPEVLSVR